MSGFALYAEPTEVGSFTVGLGENAEHQPLALVWVTDGSGTAVSRLLTADELSELIEALQSVREGFAS